MKKIYKKPSVQNLNSVEAIAPLAGLTILGPAIALVGGFAAGKAATKLFDGRLDSTKNKNLNKVICCYE